MVEQLAQELQNVRKYFERSTSVLEESDGTFAPQPGMFTIAQHVYHVAQTINWAVAGAFGEGWDLDFEQHERETREIVSLTEARAAFARAMENAQVVLQSQSEGSLNNCFSPDDPIMPGQPRSGLVGIISDHTAHHRGALTVYIRLLDKVPPVPYT